MRILENTNYDFVGKTKYAYLFTGVLLLLGLAALAFRGLELGIDFLGGTELVVATTEALEPGAVRAVLAPALGAEPEVKQYGEPTALLVRTTETGDISALRQAVQGALEAAFPASQPRIVDGYTVGPRFAEDLQRGAIYAVLGSLLVIFIYVMVRFHWTFSVGAVACLAHDVLVTLGVIALLEGIAPFSLQVDQTLVAAFLTIVGYSINDTVVVYDRIREFTNLFKTEPFDRVVNRAINSTLSRTIVTGGTTLLSLVVLFFFGGETLKGFAFTMIFGILLGTYSSIFIASPIMMTLRNWSQGRKRTAPVRPPARVAARAS
jgi:preprotein translocase SecF subunit